MNAEHLLTHYDRIGDAPDSIGRMRQFILDLAVRGKLVPQQSTDEPATGLLERINRTRAALVKSGELPKLKALPTVDEAPFPVPNSWAWTRIRSVTSDRGQRIPRDPFTYIDVTSINKEVGIVSSPRVLSADEAPSRARKVIRKGDVIYSCVRPNLLNVAVIDEDFDPRPIASTAFAVLDGYGLVLARYLWLTLRSPFMVSCVETSMRGQAYPAINDSDFAVLPISLPPFAEQQRIVAKVDELMVLCDQLAAARAQREATRDRLAAASLARLHKPDSEAFAEDARFALETLPAVTARADQIRPLRQTILNFAMSGKLSSQDEGDEPASAMLARGAPLPNGYQRRRKILKERSVAPPDDSFPPIPFTWTYSNIQTLYDLNAIIDYADGNHGALYPRSSEFGDDGIVFVTAKDLAEGKVNWSSSARLNESRAKQLPKGWSRGGDVLLTHNATVGRVARVETGVGPFLLGTSVTFYRLNSSILDADFFYYMLQSPLWQGQLEAIMAQTTRNQVSIQKQAEFRVVLPPIAEQLRIVKLLDELVTLCDQLECSLSEASAHRSRLLESLLDRALNPNIKPDAADVVFEETAS